MAPGRRGHSILQSATSLLALTNCRCCSLENSASSAALVKVQGQIKDHGAGCGAAGALPPPLLARTTVGDSGGEASGAPGPVVDIFTHAGSITAAPMGEKTD